MNNSDIFLKGWITKTKQFQKEAHDILGNHESAKSRVYILSNSYSELDSVSVKQDELFRQAIKCVEHELFRPAHVMAWAGFMDFLEEKLAEDGLVKLRQLRPKWKASSLEELREHVSEFQIIEAARDLKLCTKNQTKALHGLLNKRNECAHPSEYFPDYNQTLGYISEVLSRLKTIKLRSI